ncbi:MAG: ATP synthase subunit I [Cyanobacteriota bacterium]|nr:ATP synthase subunit I [Cyanobacteriota bacterium]
MQAALSNAVSPGVEPVETFPESEAPTLVACDTASTPNDSPPPGEAADNGMEDFRRLQQRLYVATSLASALAVVVTLVIFDWATALNLLLGAFAGLLYLRLLARSVSRLGPGERSVGKLQLLVPIVLVLAAARFPQLRILPCLIGFLLYKPALIAQAFLAP